jgi:predicted DNA-binding transcriptional regulator AlpA
MFDTVTFNRMMKIGDVAAITQLKVATIRKYVLNETIPYRKIGTALRFEPSEIMGWLDKSKPEHLATAV